MIRYLRFLFFVLTFGLGYQNHLRSVFHHFIRNRVDSHFEHERIYISIFGLCRILLILSFSGEKSILRKRDRDANRSKLMPSLLLAFDSVELMPSTTSKLKLLLIDGIVLQPPLRLRLNSMESIDGSSMGVVGGVLRRVANVAHLL